MSGRDVLTVGSLFSGIGGIDLGFERAGFEIAWQCEIDAYCRRVLHRRWPNVPCYEDIRQLGDAAPRVDVLVGGFPCQPVSSAGQRAGKNDTRWLWPEFVRVIRLLRPRYVVVENVPGLLIPYEYPKRSGRWWPAPVEEVLGDLAASGLDAEWDSFSAASVGAPHLRDRVFIVAYSQTYREPKQSQGVDATEVLRIGTRTGGGGCVGGPSTRILDVGRDAAVCENAMADASWDAETGPGAQARPVRERTGAGCEQGDVAYSNEQRLEGAESSRPSREGTTADVGSFPSDEGWWVVEPDVGRVAHGVPSRVDRLRALGNAVVPQVAEVVARRVLEIDAELGEEAVNE